MLSFISLNYLTIFMCTQLCRMKIVECRKARIYDTGFFDHPYFIHEVTVRDHAEDTEQNLLWFLVKQNICTKILFPYNFK